MALDFDCPNCGASVSFPEGQLSDRCAFCEAPLVRSAEENDEPVDLVAPFRLKQAQAAGRLKQSLSGRYLAPEAVRNATDPEDLKGVLVPFWCYDATARSQYDADVGIHWYETETYTVTVNGKTETRTRQVRRTEWHSLSGSHVQVYNDHLVSGSKGLPEREANELEPFDLGHARPFDPTLLAGLIAEKPSVDHAQARQTASEELAQRENKAIRAFLPGDECRNVHNQTETAVEDVRLVLLPVWVATYRHKDKVFRLLVNGQTGEVVGDVPRSWAKIAGAVGCIGLLLLGFALFVAILSAIGAIQ